MGTAEEELKKRRARGRLAQSAFRKRQAQAQREIKDENVKLKNAIADILAETQDSDRLELRVKVHHAVSIAGLDVSRHPSCMDSGVSVEYGAPSATSTSPSDDVVFGSSSNTASPWASWISPSDGAASRPVQSRTLSAERCSPPATRPAAHEFISRDPFHCYQCTEGAMVVLPFLGTGAFTFAGRIFWHLVEKHEALIHAQETLMEYQQRKQHILQPDGLVSAQGVLTPQMPFMNLVSTAPSVRNVGPEKWLARAQERMDYNRARGKLEQLAAFVGDTGQLPTAESTKDETSSQQWLSPFMAEKRVREIVGDDVFALLAQPVVDRFEEKRGGHLLTDSTELIDVFLDMLADSSVCHGNGPNWDARLFDEMFKTWLSAATGGQLEPVARA